jgi:hypothetical protein
MTTIAQDHHVTRLLMAEVAVHDVMTLQACAHPTTTAAPITVPASLTLTTPTALSLDGFDPGLPSRAGQIPGVLPSQVLVEPQMPRMGTHGTIGAEARQVFLFFSHELNDGTAGPHFQCSNRAARGARRLI